MRAMAAVLAVSLCAVWFVETGRAEEANWNQFRGPRGDGSTTAKGLPTKFGEGSPEIVWKTPVAGRAWSSPVVWGDQVWLTTAKENGTELFAVADDGRARRTLAHAVILLKDRDDPGVELARLFIGSAQQLLALGHGEK